MPGYLRVRFAQPRGRPVQQPRQKPLCEDPARILAMVRYELRAGLSRWIDYYNARRPHSTLTGCTPDEAYRANEAERLAA